MRASSYAGDMDEGSVRGSHLFITNDGEFSTSIVETRSRSLTSRMTSYVLGRKRTDVLSTEKATFCRITDVVKAGYLDKQGSWFKTFKRRYFVLRGDVSVLSYYESDQSLEALLGSIYLRNETTIEAMKPQRRTSLGGTLEGEMEYCFLVSTPAFKETSVTKSGPVMRPAGELMLRAKSEEERRGWIEDITYESTRGTGPRERLNKELDWWNTLFSSSKNARDINQLGKKRNTSGKGSQKKKGGGGDGGHSSRSSVRTNSESADGKGDDSKSVSTTYTNEVEKALNKINLSSVASVGGQGKGDASADRGGRDAKDSGGVRWKSSTLSVGTIDEEEDSDGENDDVDFDIERFRSTTAIRQSSEASKKHARRSNRPPNYKLPKKSDALPAPQDPGTDFSSFVTNVDNVAGVDAMNTAKTVRGIQICLELCNMVQNNAEVFVMLIGISTAGSAKDATFHELYRTEDIVVSGATSYGMPIVKCHVHFSTLSPVIPENIHSVVAAVFNADYEPGEDQRSIEQSLCYSILQKDVFMSDPTLHTHMTVSSREEQVDLTNPNVEPKSAQLGIVTVESQSLFYAREQVFRVIPYHPYSEKLFSFRVVDGCTLSNEQIFASIYGVESSRAFINMIIEEREPILEGWLKHVQTTMEIRREDLSNEDVERRRKESTTSRDYDSFMNNMQENLAEHDELITLAHRLEQAKETYDKSVCDLEDIIVLYDGVTAANLDVTDQIQNLIPGVQAGGHLRRSPWKKATLWQYATTNLNVHMITSSLLRNDQIISGGVDRFGGRDSMARPSELLGAQIDESILFSPVITMGVPAAHGMKYAKGGLRRIFTENGCETAEMRKFWMEAIQNTNNSCRDLLKEAFENGEKAFHFMKKLFGLEKHPDRQLMQQNWVETHLEVEVQAKRFALASRIEICVSQLLGFACCTLRTIINLATLQPTSKFFNVLVVSMKAGFLLPLQSLLSTQGNELGMIEDLDAAVLFLRGCDFKVMKHDFAPRKRLSKNDVSMVEKVCVKRNKRTKRLCVHLYVTSEEASVVQRAREFWNADVIPPPPAGAGAESKSDRGVPLAPVDVAGDADNSSSTSGNVVDANGDDEPGDYEVDEQDGTPLATIKMVTVFMTQGVNEMQTAVNSASYMNASSLNTQVSVNRENLRVLQDYVPEYSKWYTKMIEERGEDAEFHDFDKGRKCSDLAVSLAHLSDSVDALEKESEKKHVRILMEFAYLSRSTCGTVGILCKSGKDRTGMSATLELIRSLVEDANLIIGEKAVTTLREKGARRMNVWANTGQDMFAFNSIQRKLLPACYRPPQRTFSSNVAT